MIGRPTVTQLEGFEFDQDKALLLFYENSLTMLTTSFKTWMIVKWVRDGVGDLFQKGVYAMEGC